MNRSSRRSSSTHGRHEARAGSTTRGGPSTTLSGIIARVGEPIHILLFVAPLVLAYEIGLALLLPRHPDLIANLAHDTIFRFMTVFGPGLGLSMPAILLLVVLVVWQILSGRSWRPDVRVPLWMVLESIGFAMPLIVAGQLIATALPAAGVEVAIGSLDLWSKLVISLGAGLYEELLFRMVLILGLHTILVDIGGASSRVGTWIAVVVSACAFAAYHPLVADGGGISWARLVFFVVAGLHFGALFVTRGFGIAVGTHVAYDAIVATILLRPE